jgi:sugar/nucleoside kinase (ribokinase family)
MTEAIEIIVSGHLCLDLYPGMENVPLAALASPGKLFETGELSISTGGAVSNTGLALHRLGANVRFLATVGDDLLGQVTLAFLRDRDPVLTDFIKITPQPSAYSVLLSPQNVDRIILHCTGPNDTFSATDVDTALVAQAKIFHSGYPTLLPGLIVNDGASLIELYRKVKATGVVTSLDTALPDPNRLSGKVNWHTILRDTLPYVDVFVPSIEEIVFMLRRQEYDRWQGDVIPHVDRAYLHDLADELLAMGAVITGFKLGAMGMYLRTAATGFERFARLNINTAAWSDVEIWQPAYKVKVVGTTGAGDSAYAALLRALLHGLTPTEALQMACGVGSCNVEAADAVSGVRTWEATAERIAAGWAFNPIKLPGF